jgi:hypothetical protein
MCLGNFPNLRMTVGPFSNFSQLLLKGSLKPLLQSTKLFKFSSTVYPTFNSIFTLKVGFGSGNYNALLREGILRVARFLFLPWNLLVRLSCTEYRIPRLTTTETAFSRYWLNSG